MLHFILFLNFLKTSDNRNDNPTAGHSHYKVDEKNFTGLESSEYISAETNIGEDTKHPQQKNLIENNMTYDSDAKEERIEMVESEVLGSDTEPITNSQKNKRKSDSEGNPLKKFKSDADILKDANICFISLPQIQYQILDSDTKYPSEIETIKKLNMCILKLSEAQEMCFMVVKHMLTHFTWIKNGSLNSSLTLVEICSYNNGKKTYKEMYQENMELYEKCIEEYNKQKSLYEELSLKNSIVNWRKLDAFILKNNTKCEQLYAEYEAIILELNERLKE